MKIKNLLERCITGSLLGVAFWYIFFQCHAYVFSLILVALLFLILFFEMPRLYSYKNLISYGATLFYPIIPFLMLIYLNEHSRKHVLLIFALSCVNDIGAYVIGNLWGEYKLCPRLSPKKTIEGFIGGVITVIIVLMLFFKASLIKASIIGLPAAVVATAGDLFESWLKRRAHVKDSGNLLPGHGGLLDRFDSILAVAVFVFFFKKYFF